MIKVTFNGPKPGDLLRAVSAEIEKQLASKAKAAAGRHGGVTVRFKRKADGTPASVEFQGTEEAIEAAKAALQR